MEIVFYISAAVAVFATLMVVTHRNAVHALINLIISLLAVAVIFYTLGAPFAAALEVIIYAGAIMVLFVFVIMMLNLGPHAASQERAWLLPATWFTPTLLGLVLLGEVIYLISRASTGMTGGTMATPKAVALTLFGPYAIAVELASLVLLAGLVGAYHIGRRHPATPEEEG